jgi:hypothetical protein
LYNQGGFANQEAIVEDSDDNTSDEAEAAPKEPDAKEPEPPSNVPPEIAVAEETPAGIYLRPINLWRTVQLDAKKYQTVFKGGPKWKYVISRTYYDAQSNVQIQEVTDAQFVTDHNTLYGPIATKPREVLIVLCHSATDETEFLE